MLRLGQLIQIDAVTYLTYVAELLVEYCARIAFSFPFHLTRSLAISPASAHDLMLCTFNCLSAVLRQVSFGRPLLRVPSGAHPRLVCGRDSFLLRLCPRYLHLRTSMSCETGFCLLCSHTSELEVLDHQYICNIRRQQFM